MAKTGSPYDSYAGFVRTVIRAYWESGKASKVTFLALLLSTRETWAVALDKTLAPGAGKKALAGAAGAAAVAVLIRALLGGPLGLLLTGASVAGLVAVYVKNHDRVWARAEVLRELFDEYEPKWKAIDAAARKGSVEKEQRELMVDGLVGRLIADIHARADVAGGADEEADDEAKKVAHATGFAAHVQKKHAEEDAASAAEGGAGEGDDER